MRGALAAADVIGLVLAFLLIELADRQRRLAGPGPARHRDRPLPALPALLAAGRQAVRPLRPRRRAGVPFDLGRSRPCLPPHDGRCLRADLWQPAERQRRSRPRQAGCVLGALARARDRRAASSAGRSHDVATPTARRRSSWAPARWASWSRASCWCTTSTGSTSSASSTPTPSRAAATPSGCPCSATSTISRGWSTRTASSAWCSRSRATRTSAGSARSATCATAACRSTSSRGSSS